VLFSVTQESRSCVVSVTADQQYISKSSAQASDFLSTSSCGSRSHPWRLEAPVGQRISISLLDFAGSADHVNTGDRDDESCHQYGYVVERANKRNASICATAEAVVGGKTQRENAVYTSETNTVDIVLSAGADTEHYNFLIKLTGRLVILLLADVV
jgi:hypothetical protein